MRIAMIALIVSTLPATAMSDAGDLKPIASARTEEVISAFGPVGRMLVPAREILVEGRYPDGKATAGNLLILFDPSSGYFVWSCQTSWVSPEPRGGGRPAGLHKLHLIEEAKHDRMAIYADKDRLTGFSLMAYPRDVYIRQLTQKASNIYDAENRGLREATDLLSSLEHNYWYGWNTVSLHEALGREFFARKDSVLIGGASFLEVGYRMQNWVITLQAQWRARIVISDKYELTKIDRVN